jgi:hypothetical protein
VVAYLFPFFGYSLSGSSALNAWLSDFTIDTYSQEIKALTQQFVTTINMLIALSK